MKITLSAYLAAIRCLEKFHRMYHDPAEAAAQDLARRMFADQGRRVRALAREAFPGGVTVRRDGRGDDEVTGLTAELVRDRSVRAIFDGVFEFDGAIVRAEIMERLEDGSWRLIEVKSSAGIKEPHLHGLALQRYVIEGCGAKVSSACIRHLNRRYIYEGGEYDLEQLFVLRDLTSDILPYERLVVENLPRFRAVLDAGRSPRTVVGTQCNRPARCDFYLSCNTRQESPDSLDNLPDAGPELLARLTRLGIFRIGDIPEDFPLSARQRRARRSLIEGTLVFEPALARELENLRYPLLFMDFEASSPALPRFVGLRPFDSLPFQWSVHRLEKPDSEPVHFEFLHLDQSDPRAPFLDSLLDAVEACDGTIVVYGMDFESDRLRELAVCFPDKSGRVEKVRSRLWDLCAAVQNHVYHPGFRGAFSIKSVLPALAPEMSYDGMPVANGMDAGAAFYKLLPGDLEEAERERLVRDMRDYCRLDTLAMVYVLRRLAREVSM